MSKPISQNVPDAEKLISLTSEELAGYLLEHLHSNIINRRQRFQSENIAAEISQGEYPPTHAEKVSDAVKRGYQWLKNHDYIFDRTTNGFFDFTEKGEQVKTASEFRVSLAIGLGAESTVATRFSSTSLGTVAPKHGEDTAAKYIFLDIVGFTHNRTVEAQADIVKQLNKIVIGAVTEKAIPENKAIFIPTGDGICIGLLNVETPVDVHMQIALSILDRIHTYNASTQNKARQFQVRIGIDTNTDVLVIDINNQQNIAGAGISMASRIMGLADGDQIIVGQSVYDTLRFREKYDSAFRSYRATVKHGAVLNVYQFVAEGHKGLNTEEPKSLISAEAESSFPLQSILGNIGEHAVDSFKDEKQLYEYLESRIQKVADNIKDVSLGPGSERTPDYRQNYYNIRSQVIKQKDIYYRYLCMLATSSRVERVRNELNEFAGNQFFVGYFESYPNPIPMISFIIIDDKEVVVGAHRRLHSPSQRNSDVLIRHPSVIRLFSDYFEFLWDKAIKLNEHGIRNDLLTALGAQLTVGEKAK